MMNEKTEERIGPEEVREARLTLNRYREGKAQWWTGIISGTRRDARCSTTASSLGTRCCSPRKTIRSIYPGGGMTTGCIPSCSIPCSGWRERPAALATSMWQAMRFPMLTPPDTVRSTQEVFLGLNRNPCPGEGEFSDMENLSSDSYPLLSTRSVRGVYDAPSAASGLIAKDSLCYCDGGDFVMNGYRVDLKLSEKPKTMANRDAYYITPFKSAWGGVAHQSGSSYYYKDYAAQHVRLIVIDAMLYNDNSADQQNTWLSGLLDSAITANLHVLIAAHAPHGGAKPVACSFTRLGEKDMPARGDCDLPEAVIGTVAEKIAGGLNFVGYLCGHTHQDAVWDAAGDGSQLMYCVTCAAVDQEAQWRGSDQFRSVNADAYNLVTVDTANRLVKLIRGGGADSDDHMRARRAICIDYGSGRVAGEMA